MARKATIIGEALDIHGNAWDVRESRETGHGWPLLIGWPQSVQRGRGGQGPTVIATDPLIDYLGANRLKDLDLPIGRTAIIRLRRLAGINWIWDDWWEARREDLSSMTLENFCSKHKCSIGAASQRRAKLAQLLAQ